MADRAQAAVAAEARPEMASTAPPMLPAVAVAMVAVEVVVRL
jgi:hypothetical protein